MHVAGGHRDGKIYHIVDISDPTNPNVSSFALEEQKRGPRGQLSLHGPLTSRVTERIALRRRAGLFSTYRI
jgi:hypothetical protein